VLWIGLDDTDVRGSPGTGHLARDLAAWIGNRFPVRGVTRHQLCQDPRVPMTSKNSSTAIHLEPAAMPDLASLAQELAHWVQATAAPGSDPGLCLARQAPESVIAFGKRAKTSLVTKEEARALAGRHSLILRGLGGDGSGIIGALAAVGLAATGSDGRFTLYGRLREMNGVQPVSELVAAGVARVQSIAGQVITEGLVDTQGKLRPSLIDGLPVLWVERGDGHWKATRRD
jgi:tRNA(Ile2) C34 agmatinyltransferase TiaS